MTAPSQWLVVSQLGRLGPALSSVVIAGDGETASVRHLERLAGMPWSRSLMRCAPATTTATPIPGRAHPWIQRGGVA